MSGYGNTKIGTEWRGYYITAYGIAVKHGFQGTEEEWLKSLKGDGGEPIVIRYDETAQQLQWKYESDTQWQELLSLSELQGDVVSQTLAAAQSAKTAAEAAQSAAETAAQTTGADAAAAKSGAATATEKATAAAASAKTATDAAGEAQTAESSAKGYASTSGTNATAAAQSATDARSAKTAAETAASTATSAKTAAQTAETNAKASETAAAGSKTAAATSASKAESARSAAEDAQAAAETAASTATSAKTAAETAKTDAVSAQSKAQSAQAKAEGAATDAEESAAQVAANSKTAESWAVGGTGTREGEDSNNAKYWCESAQAIAGGGVTSFNGRGGIVKPQKGDYTAEMVGADASGAAAAVQSNLDGHKGDTTAHITAAERTKWNDKQDKLTFDTSPTANSTNPVISGGVKTELDKKANATSLGAHTGNTDNPHQVTAAQTGADPAGTGKSEAASAVSAHNSSSAAHSDIRTELAGKETAGAAATVQGNLDDHEANTTKHVTAAERTAWNAKSGKAVSFTVTLAAASWSSKAQTVSNANILTGAYAYVVTPAPASFGAYSEAIIYADNVTQAGKMTFHCSQTPTAALTVNITRIEVGT